MAGASGNLPQYQNEIPVEQFEERRPILKTPFWVFSGDSILHTPPVR